MKDVTIMLYAIGAMHIILLVVIGVMWSELDIKLDKLIKGLGIDQDFGLDMEVLDKLICKKPVDKL